MSGLVCEGAAKKCGAKFGVHAYEVSLNGHSSGRRNLCSSCQGKMEHAGYSLQQLADVPEARVVKPAAQKSPATIESWLNRKDINGE